MSSGFEQLQPRRASGLQIFVARAAKICLAFSLTASASAGTFSETFGTDPLSHGWQLFGDATLFNWNQAGHTLAVTWDSSRTNSYFYLPVGTILNRFDEFSFSMDVEFSDITAGVNPNKPGTFELGFGFLNLSEATRTNFFRGNGGLSPDLVEFDFFPQAATYEPTIWPSMWSTNSTLNYNGASDYTLMDLPVGVWMHVAVAYSASNRTLTTSLTTNGISIGAIGSVMLTTNFTDFRVGAFALESYSDAGQNPQYGGSLLAHGTVSNVVITVPPPPIQNLTGGFSNQQWQVSFLSRTNWVYGLERSTNFLTWAAASALSSGTGSNLVLTDSNVAAVHAFYRVRAQKP